MNFFCSERFCTEEELAELRSDLLSKYNVDTDRVLSDPEDRYLHPFVLSDISSCAKTIERRHHRQVLNLPHLWSHGLLASCPSASSAPVGMPRCRWAVARKLV